MESAQSSQADPLPHSESNAVSSTIEHQSLEVPQTIESPANEQDIIVEKNEQEETPEEPAMSAPVEEVDNLPSQEGAHSNGQAEHDTSVEPPPPTPPKAKERVEDNVNHGEIPLESKIVEVRVDSRPGTRAQSPSLSIASGASANAHKRSMTISKGHNVSMVLITSALETIASSKEARRSTPLRESTQRALELIRSNQGGDKPREIFEPLRLACETRNEKLMIASLDCISKLISYSFFAEDEHQASYSLPSPPPSPQPAGRPSAGASQSSIPLPSLVDLVAHTITSCHTETTPDAVSLQIVKALLSLVLSPTILVHHSSLLKAVRTVYNIFLLSTDPVNQMVAQGGLTQMVHHVFSRCRRGKAESTSQQDLEGQLSSNRELFTSPTPEGEVNSNLNGHAEKPSQEDEKRADIGLQSEDAPVKHFEKSALTLYVYFYDCFIFCLNCIKDRASRPLIHWMLYQRRTTARISLPSMIYLSKMLSLFSGPCVN